MNKVGGHDTQLKMEKIVGRHSSNTGRGRGLRRGGGEWGGGYNIWGGGGVAIWFVRSLLQLNQRNERGEHTIAWMKRLGMHHTCLFWWGWVGGGGGGDTEEWEGQSLSALPCAATGNARLHEDEGGDGGLERGRGRGRGRRGVGWRRRSSEGDETRQPLSSSVRALPARPNLAWAARGQLQALKAPGRVARQAGSSSPRRVGLLVREWWDVPTLKTKEAPPAPAPRAAWSPVCSSPSSIMTELECRAVIHRAAFSAPPPQSRRTEPVQTLAVPHLAGIARHGTSRIGGTSAVQEVPPERPPVLWSLEKSPTSTFPVRLKKPLS
ncbi:hypothetical protein BDZ91DRAFT_836493 [Kalaharituber pfeilii]|nr:hypothetical protein BDZ91DRAFT_836493 [Kalaharituber pfeilii]